MDKLMKMLERGEVPNFLEVLAALNDISDVDWSRVEALQLSIRDDFEGCRIPKHPQIQPSEFCESCS